MYRKPYSTIDTFPSPDCPASAPSSEPSPASATTLSLAPSTVPSLASSLASSPAFICRSLPAACTTPSPAVNSALFLIPLLGYHTAHALPADLPAPHAAAAPPPSTPPAASPPQTISSDPGDVH